MTPFQQFLATLVGLGVVLLTQTVMFLMAWMQRRKVDEINDAVNHRHERGDGALKLYDLVYENHKKTDELVEWNKRQDGRLVSLEEIVKHK